MPGGVTASTRNWTVVPEAGKELAGEALAGAVLAEPVVIGPVFIEAVFIEAALTGADGGSDAGAWPVKGV